MSAIDGREFFEVYEAYDNAIVINNRNTNNGVEQSKNSEDIDNKEDNKKQFVKMNNNDENRTNKMSE